MSSADLKAAKGEKEKGESAIIIGIIVILYEMSSKLLLKLVFLTSIFLVCYYQLMSFFFENTTQIYAIWL